MYMIKQAVDLFYIIQCEICYNIYVYQRPNIPTPQRPNIPTSQLANLQTYQRPKLGLPTCQHTNV